MKLLLYIKTKSDNHIQTTLYSYFNFIIVRSVLHLISTVCFPQSPRLFYSNFSAGNHMSVAGPSDPWSRDSQGQETFLASSGDQETCSYDKNHQPSNRIKALGLSRCKRK